MIDLEKRNGGKLTAQAQTKRAESSCQNDNLEGIVLERLANEFLQLNFSKSVMKLNPRKERRLVRPLESPVPCLPVKCQPQAAQSEVVLAEPGAGRISVR